jgi:Protein kinase domain
VRGIIRHTMPLAAGTKLDGYEVLGLLGSGGMGEVYRARDSVLKREVAIKVLRSFVSEDPDRLRRFEQEAQAAAALNHPNILAVHRFGTFEGAPYLVSELLVGDTLRQQLERGPLPVRKAIDYGVQIAHGLAAAHDKGIVHRDLKPENLLVTKEGRVKILDSGLAKLVQSQPDRDGSEPTQTHGTDPGLIMGTVGYMSPEQVRGKTVDHRADIFAFGAILYEMLSGKRAFQRSTSADTMSAILNEDPPATSQIVQSTPMGLQRVVHRCLEKSPEQRFQSALDLAFALEAVSESGISGVVAIGAPGLRRRRQGLAWLIGVCAAFALAAGAYFFLGGRQEKVPFEHFSVEKAMDSENVDLAAISQDGTYLAAVVHDTKGSQSLWIRHIPTNSERAILQDAAFKSYRDVIFSPDGSFIYFRIHAIGAHPPNRIDVYRIPVLGGQPARILEDVDRPLSFIDGGRRVCFYRQYVATDTYKFLSASADGGDEQVLANGKRPFPLSVACAPNGRIAVVADQLGNIETLDLASGSKRTLISSTALAGWLPYLGWAPNGKGLIAIRHQNSQSSRGQLSFLSYPGGKSYQITSDPSDYQGISLTLDGKTLATTQNDSNGRFEVLSLADPSRTEEYGPRGLIWFKWLDNGKIVASDEVNAVKVVDLLRDETTTLNAAKGHFFYHPTPCGEDTLVATGGTLNDTTVGIYKMQFDGSGATQMTQGPVDFLPECTADGR